MRSYNAVCQVIRGALNFWFARSFNTTAIRLLTAEWITRNKTLRWDQWRRLSIPKHFRHIPQIETKSTGSRWCIVAGQAPKTNWRPHLRAFPGSEHGPLRWTPADLSVWRASMVPRCSAATRLCPPVHVGSPGDEMQPFKSILCAPRLRPQTDAWRFFLGCCHLSGLGKQKHIERR